MLLQESVEEEKKFDFLFEKMPVDLDNSSTVSGEASVSSTGNQNQLPKSAGKKKRNLPGMPGNLKIQTLCNSNFIIFILFLLILFKFLTFLFLRSRLGSHSFITENFTSNKPIRLRNLQQRVSERPESAASPSRPQSSMETKTEIEQRSEEKGLRLS